MKKSDKKDKNFLNYRLKAATWGIKIAWQIDAKAILGWTALSVIISVLPAIALLFQQQIIAKLSVFIANGTGQLSDITSYIILLGIILVFSGLSNRLTDQLLYMMMYDTYYLGLEEVMMDTAQRVELKDLMKKETSDHYYSAIKRGGSLTDLMSSGCALMGRLTSIVSLMIVASRISLLIFLVTLLYVALVFAVTFHYSNETRVVCEDIDNKKRLAESFENLTRSTEAAKEIRLFENIDIIKTHWKAAYERLTGTFIRQHTSIAKISLAGSLGLYVLLIFSLLFSVFQVSKQEMGPDILILIYTMFISLSGVVYAVPYSIQKVDYGLYGLDIQRRFFESIPYVDSKEDALKADTPIDDNIIFEAQNLSFGYKEDTPVLKNLSFSIKNGEVIAFVGENGCGKTTLVKNLLGVYKPTSGLLKFMGRPYSDYKAGWIAQQIGVFFQDFFLYHFTMGENVGVGDIDNVNNQERIKEAMHHGGAYKLIDKFPDGLKSIINRAVYKNGIVPSGGEGQRIAVSRAHMSNRPIMVFDEPASMLDPIAEMEQFFEIKDRIKGRTAILVSHRIGFARLADRIFVLKDGQIVEQGTHAMLIDKNGVYTELFNEQAQWYDLENSEIKAEV